MRGRRGGAGRYNGALNNASRCGFHLLRGSIKQLQEKYEELSRCADSDLEAENFRQHAEHYRRAIRQEDTSFIGDINGRNAYRPETLTKINYLAA